MSTMWLNGVLLDADAARIDPADRGFTLGDGVFETIRVAGGKPVWPDRHFARLRNGAAVLGINIPYGDTALHDAMLAILQASASQDAALRLTLTRGPAPRGVLPAHDGCATVLVTVSPLPEPLPPARLIIAMRTRRNEYSPLSRVKSLNYLDSIIARLEAAERGADDAVLLNTSGMVAEATASTVIVHIGSDLVTPFVAAGALPGVARAVAIDAGAVMEAAVTPGMLREASGIALLNVLGLRAACMLDGRQMSPDMRPFSAVLAHPDCLCAKSSA